VCGWRGRRDGGYGGRGCKVVEREVCGGCGGAFWEGRGEPNVAETLVDASVNKVHVPVFVFVFFVYYGYSSINSPR